MRARTKLLLSTTAGLTAAAGFAVLSQAGEEHSASTGPRVVSRPFARPDSANAAPIPSLARALPSFGRARSAPDALGHSTTGTPREAILFGVRERVDAGASRRVYSADGRVVFAAPSADRRKVCFALTDDRPDAVWAHNFCESSTTLRARPVIWSVSMVRSDSGGRLVFAWGIASRAVTRVTVTTEAGVVAATPNADGIFVIDLAGRGDPSEIAVADGRGRIVERHAVPGGSLG